MKITTKERWTSDGLYYEYSKAANPIAAGLTTRVPLADFPRHLHESGPTRIIPFDLSDELKCPGPATSPALCSNFIRIQQGEHIRTAPNATSELYYVIRGKGSDQGPRRGHPLEQGRFPHASRAEQGGAFRRRRRGILLGPRRALAPLPGRDRDHPAVQANALPQSEAAMELEKVEHDPEAAKKSRVSVLLANKEFPQTRTITHVIWAMFGVLPAGAVQLPHHHESVALDFIIDCQPGCYTLIGEKLDDQGNIVDGKRADWKPGSAFVTPPGLWHSHHNESGAPAHLMPIQDAGLHTYLRTLDIHFVHKDPKVYISQKG